MGFFPVQGFFYFYPLQEYTQMKLRTGDRQRTDYMNRIINFTPTQKELDTAQENMGLVVTTLKRFKGLAEDRDLIQAGFLGLVKASHEYSIERGSFSSCAIPWILQAMRFEVERSGRTVIIPLPKIHRLYKIQGAQNRLRHRLHREPTIKEISDTLELKENQVLEALSLANNTTSLNTPDGEREDDRLASLADPETIGKPEDVINSILQDALRSLKPLEQKVVVESIVEKRPLREIGKEVKLSRESVRLIKNKALRTMRESIEVCQ
jgi:RNA polymerase primary sigma factor